MITETGQIESKIYPFSLPVNWVEKWKKFKVFYTDCRKSNTSFIHLAIRYFFYRTVYRKIFYLHQHVFLKGAGNIEQSGKLYVGTGIVGFSHESDKTYLNIQGKLIFRGNYSIGRGCRFDIGENATVVIGENGYVSPDSHFVIMHNLAIGDHSVISWNCRFLDDDFHEISYPGRKEGDRSISIGNHVWIGCGVNIYKGAVIPDNCVVASNSVIKSRFDEENCLIGGNPARILKRNVTWR